MNIFGFAGYSNSGKTTLIEKLVPRLTARGLSVSLIKHAHHGFDLDRPGKDSYRHRAAGCGEVLIASDRRWALLHEQRDPTPPRLDELLTRLSPCDLVLVEGCKDAAIPKLEVHRATNGQPWLHPADPHIVALACDTAPESALPTFALEAIDDIARFIINHLELDIRTC
jgi:molybdopterin-guanine dinucleotide biosynthesis protein B